MTHSYNITGMTCTGCQAKVRALLSKVEGVKTVTVDLSQSQALIEMETHIPTNKLQAALKDYPTYKLTENGHHVHHAHHQMEAPAEEISSGETKTWFETYKPILIICAYILGLTVLLEAVNGAFDWHRWMQHFMAGFFLVFSFFKLLDLRGFADSYSTYDIIAKRWRGWSYVYAFTELALGVAFATGFNPLLTNAVTFVVMTISIIGVLQSVLNKRKIRCACLGAVFNLPMSTVTIIEDAMMIGMSLVMLISMIGG